MTDIERIVLGGLAGVTVYLIGQLLSKFLLEPLHELRKAVGDARYNLAFHAPTIHTPIGRSKETSKTAQQALMDTSCNLIVTLHAVPGYAMFRYVSFGALPNRKDIETAAVLLRGLSTYVHEEGDRAHSNISVVNERVSKIEKLLRFKPLE